MRSWIAEIAKVVIGIGALIVVVWFLMGAINRADQSRVSSDSRTMADISRLRESIDRLEPILRDLDGNIVAARSGVAELAKLSREERAAIEKLTGLIGRINEIVGGGQATIKDMERLNGALRAWIEKYRK